jgi:hypothetical protein
MILHIFRKDVRRLWPGIALSLAVLASLAWQDRWRSDWMPGEAESYLNLLVPLVWALLIGLAVEQEPIAGDRQFWLTRPYRHRDLLAAKLLFAVVFVHAPSFLADCYILASRGFSPVSYAPELLVKQALLAGALTLPAIALASLVSAFSHFVLELVAVAAAVLLFSGMFNGTPFFAYWEPFSAVRTQTLIVCAAAGATLVVGLQYLMRRVAWSRALAGISAAASLAIFLLFVPRTALAIRAFTRPADSAPAIRLDPTPREKEKTASREIVVDLPIVLSGVPAGTLARLDAVRTQVVSSAGQRWTEDLPTKYRPFDPRPFQVWVRRSEWNERFPVSLSLQFDPKFFAAIQASPVTIRGEAGATLTRFRQSVWMSIGESAYIEGAGRCYTTMVEDRFAQRIKLECESPRHSVGGIRARLWSPRSGREWVHGLGQARTNMGSPRIVWLSPLDRDVAFWDVVPDPLHPADTWRVPASEAASTRIEITPQEVLGYSAVPYEFSGLDLRRYRTEPLIRANAR